MDPIWHSDEVFNNLATNVTSNVRDTQLPSLEAFDFWPWQAIVITLYSTTAFVSLGSNLIAIIVLLKGDRMSSELWKFLINLSLSDIVMSIFSIPFTYSGFMLGRWIFSPQLCPITDFAQICSLFVSVWTLTIIGIDQYFAIVHPLYSILLLHWIRSHKLYVMLTLWFSGIVVGFDRLLQVRAVPFHYGPNVYYDCREEWDPHSGDNYTLSVFIISFAAPVFILIVVYSAIAYHILRHGIPVIPGNPDHHRDETQDNRKIKIIKMLATIAGLFALCWLPIHVFTLLIWFHPLFLNVETEFHYVMYVSLYFVCHWLSMAHSFVNPIVYCFMSENFRMNLRSLANGCLLRLRVYRKQVKNEEVEDETQGQTLISLHSS